MMKKRVRLGAPRGPPWAPQRCPDPPPGLGPRVRPPPPPKPASRAFPQCFAALTLRYASQYERNHFQHKHLVIKAHTPQGGGFLWSPLSLCLYLSILSSKARKHRSPRKQRNQRKPQDTCISFEETAMTPKESIFLMRKQ